MSWPQSANKNGYEWPLEALNWLAELWAGGVSASVCAAAISREYDVDISRVAVISQVGRRNMPRTPETVAAFDKEIG